MAIEQVEPARCVLWQFHERFGEELNNESCRELIASIQRHGQRHPVLGRRLAGPRGSSIELIYGSRRLFAAAELGVKLLVDVRELNDRAGIVEMEIENRLRADVSPYERGMSYRRWLNARLFASQAELAKDLGLSEAQISRLLRYADLPAAVVGAFETVQSIREEWAVTLAKVCQDPSRRPLVLRRAREISQVERRYPAHVVFRRLVSGAHIAGRDASRTRDEVVKSPSGRPIYRIAVRTKTVHFIVPREGLSEHVVRELKRQLTSTLEPITNAKSTSRVSYVDAAKQLNAYESVVASA
jgi:ParB family transcriptional regulator, chromosome partitioning protein